MPRFSPVVLLMAVLVGGCCTVPGGPGKPDEVVLNLFGDCDKGKVLGYSKDENDRPCVTRQKGEVFETTCQYSEFPR